ncbi:hypothetical protein V5O48_009589 [Marasmius crinis-equi]|uniref:Uncharacterized protein n=1 Tax=Marasmius crinis-equi TaxID=585013 RepID=A0ABR3FAW3_9AGAR
MAAQDTTTAVEGGILYSFPEAAPPFNFPNIPSPSQTRHPHTKRHSYFGISEPGWITAELPYLGFVPANNPFTTDWLRPLRYNFRTVPVERQLENKFHLAENVVKEWDSLERNFRALLTSSMASCNCSLPPPFRLWSYPSQYGYKRAHSSEFVARRQTIASRDAFLPLMAALSFFVHMSLVNEAENKLQEEVPITTHQLHQFMKNIRHDSDTWLSHVISTFLGGPFVGGYVDIKEAGILRWLKLFHGAKLPVCLSWGPCREYSQHNVPSFLRHIRPSNEQIRGLLHDTQFSCDADAPPPFDSLHSEAEFDHTSTQSILSCLPAVEAGSGQRPHEHISDFFHRRHETNSGIESSESDLQRATRITRQKEAGSGVPPGPHYARVFYWELRSGSRVRTAVWRKKEVYDWYWSAYSSLQRRYDSFHDEWDVCTEFAPEDQSVDHTEVTLDLYADEESAVAVGYTPDDYMHRMHGPLQPVSSSHPPKQFDASVEDIAYHRFGFVPASIPESKTCGNPPISWDSVLGMLGLSKATTPVRVDGQGTPQRLSFFLDELLSAEQFRGVASGLDLVDPSQSINQPWPFTIHFRLIDGGMYIFSCDQWARAQVAVKSSVAVLDLVRRRLTTNHAMIEILVEEGVSFRTLACERFDESEKGLHTPPSRSGANLQRRNIVSLVNAESSFASGCRAKLGFRSHGYRFTLEDYFSYAEMRDKFLSSPRGRAAIMFGGIVSRLAQGIVTMRDVVEGPTQESQLAYERGDYFVDEGNNHVFYYDDTLTEDEINLICGVYEVATGSPLPNGTLQTSEVSWFPKPGAWKKSGLNCGYWSHDAEAWFQRRLDHIATGESKLFTSAVWKSMIKFDTKTRRMYEKAEKLAAQYLWPKVE